MKIQFLLKELRLHSGTNNKQGKMGSVQESADRRRVFTIVICNIYYFLSSSYCSKYFTCITSFEIHKNSRNHDLQQK